MSAPLRDLRRLQKIPLTRDWLEHFRLHVQRRVRASMVGSQLNRRQGQSRDFLELTPYVAGDDARTIDWRASLRYKDADDLLVRRYMAEEHYNLVLSMDTRATMLLPAGLPKVQLALWFAEALGWMALRSGHRVTLHRLFGPRAGGLHHFNGAKAGDRLAASLRALYATPVDEEVPNLADLDRILPPTSIWLILTDLYFGDPANHANHFLGESAHRLGQRIVRAQSGWRWIILVDIDSWQYEARRLYGERALELQGYGLPTGKFLHEVSPEVWAAKAAAVADFKRSFIELAKLRPGSIVNCVYPEGDLAQASYGQSLLREQLQRQPVLQRLLMEEA